MIRNLTEWDEDDKGDAEDEYEALRRSLSWTEEFGLLFVDCTPATAEKLIKDIKQDLPQKRIEVLRLTEPIENLYTEIAALPNRDSIDILFIQGLEHSIYDYEKTIKDNTERRNYSLFSVPRLLGHLNLQRESFRDHFNICFVFLLPKFALTYFNRRAPDFYDWRSGMFKLENRGDLALAELSQSEEAFWLKQGEQRFIVGDLVDAIACCDKALDISPDSHIAWSNRGIALAKLERIEAAIISYDHALKIKPDSHTAWFNLGNALSELGRIEEAIASYDKALQFKPDSHEAWNNRGLVLSELGRFEEAIASYDKALQFKPDSHEAWNNRGLVLSELGRIEEAIASYYRALQFKPDYHQAWNNRGNALFKLGRLEAAIASFDQALQIQPDLHQTWDNRGNALSELGQIEEAIVSYNKALEIKPDDANAFYGKACCYALQNQINLALENLQQAITLNPDECRDMAKTNSELDNLRQEPRFQALIQDDKD
ncbi:MAG: tetratricopeptide repeat protein [Coleofasciculus sp. G1-WW12-02]|uniref:tetratricopeptide repeat protein n=1 Tax=Coleofasciculus sp. G1-WW12-02 TaxID=3068483 RepID=UPI0032FD4A62